MVKAASAAIVATDGCPMDARRTAETLLLLRDQKPIVHSLVGAGAAECTAAMLQAVGARPILGQGLDEAEDLATIASALIASLQMPSSERLASIRLATREAREVEIPWVLEVHGLDHSSSRTSFAMDILQNKPSVVKGTSAEIMTLAKQARLAKRSVELEAKFTESAIEPGRLLADATGNVVAITGYTDYVTDGERTMRIDCGDAMQSCIPGLSTGLAALMAAFLSVERDRMTAAVHALSIVNVAGELAGVETNGPGSFRAQFLDRLYDLNHTGIASRLKVAAA
jgi:hydroxyethylthiazole kinase